MEEAHSVDDVQRLYIVLRPVSGERPVEEKQDEDSGKEGAKKGSKSGGSGPGTSEGGHGSQVSEPVLIIFTRLYVYFCYIS